MIRFSWYLIILIAFTSCKSTDKLDIDNSLSESAKTSLLDLQSYIEPQWDNTYNFRHDRIQLPKNYKELVWKTEVGEIVKGSNADTVYLKYLIYGEMLDSLLINNNDEIHYTEFEKYYGRPSLLSTTRDGKITDFNYLFNSRKHPNCSCNAGTRFYLGGNCSLLDFQFNDKGYLIYVHKSMFSF